MLFLGAQSLPQPVLPIRVICEPVTVWVGTEKDGKTNHPNVHFAYFTYIITSHLALPGCGFAPSTDEKRDHRMSDNCPRPWLVRCEGRGGSVADLLSGTEPCLAAPGPVLPVTAVTLGPGALVFSSVQ